MFVIFQIRLPHQIENAFRQKSYTAVLFVSDYNFWGIYNLDIVLLGQLPEVMFLKKQEHLFIIDWRELFEDLIWHYKESPVRRKNLSAKP